MNVSLSETSAYKLWKGLALMCENPRLIPRKMIYNFFVRYMTTNSLFAKQRGGKTSLSWKVMVKINLSELIVLLMTKNVHNDAVDEFNFHKLWQLIHLENMTVFFEKVIELIDNAAPLNDYVVASTSLFSALSCIVKPNQNTVIDFLHYVCYFYCGTSPGFLHKHEVILLLQDLSRDWNAIFDRIFSFCEVHGNGTVTLQMIKSRCPMLPIDDSKSSQDVILRSESITKESFCDFMRQKVPCIFCTYKIEITV